MENLNNPDNPLKFKGTPPPQFFEALKEIRGQKDEQVREQKMKDPFADVQKQEPVVAQEETVPEPQAPEPAPAKAVPPRPQSKQQKQFAEQQPKKFAEQRPTSARQTGSSQLEQLIHGLKPTYSYDEIVLPSRGVFYTGTDGPVDGILHIRPMTGDEEQILATPRYLKRGVALNMIFERCLKENYKTEGFLSVDRTFLLIWLRGISYGHEYDVEIKCPDCERKFGHGIRLDQLVVRFCPEELQPPLQGKLPKSGYNFVYRLLRGRDEVVAQDYKDRRIKEYGDSAIDDSLIYRMSLMLEEIEGLTNKTELMILLKKLPVQDIAYLRGLATDPNFGVDTKVPITCPSCYHDFDVELPLAEGFFFPRHRRKEEMPSNSGDI